MDDLISREAILGYPLRRGNAGCDEANANPHFLNGVESVMEYALDLPTVAAEPVRHARWTMNSDRPDTIICNVCDSGFDVWKHEAKDFQYCPGCGARMDAKEDAEQFVGINKTSDTKEDAE